MLDEGHCALNLTHVWMRFSRHSRSGVTGGFRVVRLGRFRRFSLRGFRLGRRFGRFRLDRHILFHGLAEVAHSIFELANRFAHGTGQLGQILRPKDEQDDTEDEEEQQDPGEEAEYFAGFDPTPQKGCRL